ncbi:MAG: glycosyltransferase family 2 protein [Planctomycetaceae bacterium]
MAGADTADDARVPGSRRCRIAVLMTCHNRRALTLRCLESLRAASTPVSSMVDVAVFLVDDGCTDGTGTAVAERFPDVTIVPGTGSLYWCGGMRTAWRAAARAGGFDAYLWLNDDVRLEDGFLACLLDTAATIRQATGRSGIVVGATADEAGGGTSYGEMGPEGIRPAGDAARPIDSFNGNIVLVPDEVFRELGGFSRVYSHGFGDIDYACRARRLGIPIWLAPGHLGSCTMDKASRWERPDVPLWQRLVALHRPTGCPPWELAFLTIRHGGWWFPYTVARLYWRAIFPQASRGPAPGRENT